MPIVRENVSALAVRLRCTAEKETQVHARDPRLANNLLSPVPAEKVKAFLALMLRIRDLGHRKAFSLTVARRIGKEQRPKGPMAIE